MTKTIDREESEDEEKYREEFVNVLKNIKKDGTQGPVTTQDQRGQVMDDDDNREDAEDFLLDQEEELDFFAKQRKLAERK